MGTWGLVAHEDRFPQNGNIDLDDPILLFFFLVLSITD